MKVVIGRYIHASSLVHSLNPSAKLLISIILVISVILSSSPLDYSIVSIVVFTLVLSSGINPLIYLKGIKSIWMLIAFAVIVQLIYSNPLAAAESFIRLVLILISAEILTFTTKPTDLAHSFEDVMKIFGVKRKARQELSMVMTIAVRFAPVMLEEIDRISKAQISRGAKIDSGGIFQRIKALVSITIPLMASAVRKAEEIATAMEARRFDPSAERVRFVQYDWGKKENLVLLLSILTLFLVTSL